MAPSIISETVRFAEIVLALSYPAAWSCANVIPQALKGNFDAFGV